MIPCRRRAIEQARANTASLMAEQAAPVSPPASVETLHTLMAYSKQNMACKLCAYRFKDGRGMYTHAKKHL